MKKEEFYEALGDIDENAVKEAERQPPKIKRHWGGIALATAACMCAVLAAGIMMNLKDTGIDKHDSSFYDSSNCSDMDISSSVPKFADVDIYAYQNGSIIKHTQNVEYSDAGVFSAWLKLNGLAQGEEADEFAKMMHYDGDYFLPPAPVQNSSTSSGIDETSEDIPQQSYTNDDGYGEVYVTVPEEFKQFYNKMPHDQLDKSLMLTLQSYAKLDWSIDMIQYTFTSKAERESMQANVIIYSYNGGSIKEEKGHVSENSPQQIFDAWKSSCGIGDEVKLTECDDEATYGDESNVSTKLKLTITAELRNYYDKMPEEMLLETLKKTMKANDPSLDFYSASVAQAI